MKLFIPSYYRLRTPKGQYPVCYLVLCASRVVSEVDLDVYSLLIIILEGQRSVLVIENRVRQRTLCQGGRR